MSDLRTAALEVERLQAARERDNVSFKQLLAQRDELLEVVRDAITTLDRAGYPVAAEELRSAVAKHS